MKRSKGMQLGALLAAMLLVSMALVPAVTAQVEKEQIEKQLKDVKIDWITNKEDKKEYMYPMCTLCRSLSCNRKCDLR